MIPFFLTLGAIALGTIVPVYVGLYAISLIRPSNNPRRIKYVSAFGLGILLYFFTDVTLDSTELGVNSGFSFQGPQIGLLVSFVVGVLILSLVEHQFFHIVSENRSPSATSSRAVLFLVPALVAIGIGVHGTGEGSSFAFVASGTTFTSLVDAFGGYTAMISYIFHKFLEAIIVGVAYYAYTKCNFAQAPTTDRSRFWEIPILGALIWIPSIIGTTIGYYVALNPVYFYAFASGASVYALLRLGRPIFHNELVEDNDFSQTMLYISVLALIGFLLLYVAALFHSG